MMFAVAVRFASLAFLFALLSPACQKRADEITIGVAGPMTGDQSKLGEDLRIGVSLAVDEWNAKGGVLGKRVRAEVADDQHDPRQAVSVANKLVNLGVAGVVGHFNSSSSIPASEVYRNAMIPMITPASTNPQVTDRQLPNVFRICGRDDQQGLVAARFVVDQLKPKRVAILHDKTTYGQGLADEFKRWLADLSKGSVQVVSYQGIIQGDKDFRGVLTSLSGLKPELIFFGGIYPEGGLIAKQARELGLLAPILSGDGVIDPEFVKIAGPAAEGTYLTFADIPAERPETKRFLDLYSARHGKRFAPYAVYAYDAANVLLSAIKDAQSSEGKNIIEALRRIRFEGATGTIQFDPKGDVLKSPYVVWIVKNGDFDVFWKPAA